MTAIGNIIKGTFKKAQHLQVRLVVTKNVLIKTGNILPENAIYLKIQSPHIEDSKLRADLSVISRQPRKHLISRCLNDVNEVFF